MNKGSMSIGLAVVLITGIILAAVVVGGVVMPGLNDVENASKSGNENASMNVENASCIADCKEKNPGDYSAFMRCRENQGCAE